MAQKPKIASTPSRRNQQKCLSNLLTIRAKPSMGSATGDSPSNHQKSTAVNPKRGK